MDCQASARATRSISKSDLSYQSTSSFSLVGIYHEDTIVDMAERNVDLQGVVFIIRYCARQPRDPN
jgi:hypothetical protein